MSNFLEKNSITENRKLKKLVKKTIRMKNEGEKTMSREGHWPSECGTLSAAFSDVDRTFLAVVGWIEFGNNFVSKPVYIAFSHDIMVMQEDRKRLGVLGTNKFSRCPGSSFQLFGYDISEIV